MAESTDISDVRLVFSAAQKLPSIQLAGYCPLRAQIRAAGKLVNAIAGIGPHAVRQIFPRVRRNDDTRWQTGL